MSSPLIDVQRRQLYVSTLAGHVVAINCVSILSRMAWCGITLAEEATESKGGHFAKLK